MMSATSGIISFGVSGLNNATLSCGVTSVEVTRDPTCLVMEPLPTKPVTSNLAFFSPLQSVRCHRHRPMPPCSCTPSLYDTTHNLRRSIEQKDQFICDTTEKSVHLSFDQHLSHPVCHTFLPPRVRTICDYFYTRPPQDTHDRGS